MSEHARPSLEVEPGETVREAVSYVVDSRSRLDLLLTDEAAYWKDPTLDLAPARLPFSEMRCSVSTSSRLPWDALGLTCVVIGAVLAALGRLGGLAAIAVGLGLLALGGQRRVLRLDGPDQRFRWKGPIVFDRASRRDLDAQLHTISDWAQSNGAEVRWTGPAPPAT